MPRKKTHERDNFPYHIHTSNWGMGTKYKHFDFVSKRDGVVRIYGTITTIGGGEYEVLFKGSKGTKKVRLFLGRGFRLTYKNADDVLKMAYRKAYRR